jgi:hypothetical protein
MQACGSHARHTRALTHLQSVTASHMARTAVGTHATPPPPRLPPPTRRLPSPPSPLQPLSLLGPDALQPCDLPPTARALPIPCECSALTTGRGRRPGEGCAGSSGCATLWLLMAPVASQPRFTALLLQQQQALNLPLPPPRLALAPSKSQPKASLCDCAGPTGSCNPSICLRSMRVPRCKGMLLPGEHADGKQAW